MRAGFFGRRFWVDVGDGIDVEEGEGFAQIFIPVAQAPFGLGRGKRAAVWKAVGMGLLWLLMPVALAILKGVHLSRVLHPRDGLDLIASLMLAIVLLIYEGTMVLGVVALLRKSSPQRVEIVVDKRGIRQRAWGPMDAWRVPMHAVRGIDVMIATYRRGWPRWMRDAQLVRVRVDAGRHSRSLVGPYSYEAMMRLAWALAQQLERVAMVVVEVRDEVSGVAAAQEPEEILARCGVGVERVAEGMRVRIGGFVQAVPRDGAGEGYMMSPLSRWGGLIGVAVIVTAAVLGNMNGGMRVFTGIILVGGLIALWAWIGFLLTGRISYTVGAAGMEREIEVLRIWRRRRLWGKGEIVEIVVWNRWGGRVRQRTVGMVLSGGRRVTLAVGAGPAAEALVAVLRRELGMGVDGG
jgi:hypothetical protein